MPQTPPGAKVERAHRFATVLCWTGVQITNVATKFQKLFRDISLPVSNYSTNRNVFNINLKSYEAIESPVRKSKPTGGDVSNNWIKDREDRNREETYHKNLIRATEAAQRNGKRSK